MQQQMNAATQLQSTEVSNTITPDHTNTSSPTIATGKVSDEDEKKKKDKKDEDENDTEWAEKGKRTNRIPVYKDKKTMNLDERLYRGITKSAYYASLR